MKRRGETGKNEDLTKASVILKDGSERMSPPPKELELEVERHCPAGTTARAEVPLARREQRWQDQQTQ